MGSALARYVLQGWVFHQFEDEHAFFDTVDPRNVGMIVRGQYLGFAGEARETVGVCGENVGQDLYGDFAIELGIDGTVARRPCRPRPVLR